MSYKEALEAMWNGKYDDALAELQGPLATNPSGDVYALAGLAYFKKECYHNAAEHYAKACHAGGAGIDDWRKWQALAKANATAEINVEVPKPEYFDRDTLLAPPKVRD